MKNVIYKVRLMLLGIFIALGVNAVAQVGGGAAISGRPWDQTPSFDTLIVTGTSQFESLHTLVEGFPRIRLIETGAAADNTRWFIGVDNERLTMAVHNDASSVVTDWLQVDRTGTTVDSIDLLATTLLHNGNEATHNDGSFTLNFAAACTTTPSSTVKWARAGNAVTIRTTSFTCTSDSTSFLSDADFPAEITPTDRHSFIVSATDNSVAIQACAEVTTGGRINMHTAFSTSGCLTGGWIGSGNKNLHEMTLTYILN